MGATLSLAHRGSLGSDHILYSLLSGSSDIRQVRLRSRRPFVPGARNLLNNLARLGIHASEWKNYKWKMECCASCFYARDRCQACWDGLTPSSLSKAQPPADWCWAIPFVHAQMGSPSFTELRVWRL